jgi:hypothetical protein
MIGSLLSAAWAMDPATAMAKADVAILNLWRILELPVRMSCWWIFRTRRSRNAENTSTSLPMIHEQVRAAG